MPGRIIGRSRDHCEPPQVNMTACYVRLRQSTREAEKWKMRSGRRPMIASGAPCIESAPSCSVREWSPRANRARRRALDAGSTGRYHRPPAASHFPLLSFTGALPQTNIACRHVYLRRLAVIPAPAYDPPWHLRPSCVLTCAASARSRPTEAPRWSTPIVVRVTHAIKENDGAYVNDMVALRGRDARGSCLDR